MEQIGKVTGSNGRQWPERKLTQDESRERDNYVARRRGEGASLQTLADELGCSRGTVHGIIKRLRAKK